MRTFLHLYSIGTTTIAQDGMVPSRYLMNFSFGEVLYNKVIIEKAEKDFRGFDTNPYFGMN